MPIFKERLDCLGKSRRKCWQVRNHLAFCTCICDNNVVLIICMQSVHKFLHFGQRESDRIECEVLVLVHIVYVCPCVVIER